MNSISRQSKHDSVWMSIRVREDVTWSEYRLCDLHNYWARQHRAGYMYLPSCLWIDKDFYGVEYRTVSLFSKRFRVAMHVSQGRVWSLMFLLSNPKMQCRVGPAALTPSCSIWEISPCGSRTSLDPTEAGELLFAVISISTCTLTAPDPEVPSGLAYWWMDTQQKLCTIHTCI